MLLDISGELKQSAFPIEVFDERLQHNFQQIADQYSLPLDYLGTTALYLVASLAGNMYTTELNGNIKNIIYAMLLGPSGLGKTPCFTHLYESFIAPHRNEMHKIFVDRHKLWSKNQELAAKNKQEFDDPEPQWMERIAKGGTMEGIIVNSSKQAAGFGLYYDEGMKMLSSPNAYKKNDSSTDFWNEVWNGASFIDLRADASLQRSVSNTCISTLIGLQTERLNKVFTADNIISGLSSRFLINYSEMLWLNENVDHFRPGVGACDWWKEIIISLYKAGYGYDSDSKPKFIPFTSPAKTAYNDLSKRLIQYANKIRMGSKIGDREHLMIGYDSKLYRYVGRFMSILAIMENYETPKIQQKHVEHAEKLYWFYRNQAQYIISLMQKEADTDLTAQERDLLDLLPDKFTTNDAKQQSELLNLSSGFFDSAFRRKYKGIYVKKINRGSFEKL